MISPGGTKAYVVLREIAGGRTDPRPPQRLPARGRSGTKVGSEPTGIAMTPSGNRLFVANWVDGTLSEVDASRSKMKVKSTIDLNAALASTKLLGDVAARPPSPTRDLSAGIHEQPQ